MSGNISFFHILCDSRITSEFLKSVISCLCKQKSGKWIRHFPQSCDMIPTLALSKSGFGSKFLTSSQPVYKLPVF